MAKRPADRDPAKHSKKDPAKPTRAKAARPDAPPLDPALADLLNPAIGRGRAGVGSQTGITHETRNDAPPYPVVAEEGEAGPKQNSPAATRSSTRGPYLPTPAPGPSPQGGAEQ